MIKKGFTLAEVLVTLGIIGVVAAITLPTLVQNSSDRQIGPKLLNAVSVLENANATLLGAEYDRLDSIPNMTQPNGNLNIGTYTDELRSALKISSVNGSNFSTKNGIEYRIVDLNSSPAGGGDNATSDANLPSEEKIANITININGTNGNNVNATDLFYFSLMNDGSLIPFGAQGWRGNRLPNNNEWSNQCPDNQTPTNAIYCAGSIFAHEGRVMYK